MLLLGLVACATSPRSSLAPVTTPAAEEHHPVAGRGGGDGDETRSGMSAAALLARGDAGEGKPIYDAECARCHGADGKGDGELSDSLEKKPRDFRDREYMQRLTPLHLYRVVRDGGGAVELSRAMPAFGRRLDDEQIADVLAFVRSLSR